MPFRFFRVVLAIGCLAAAQLEAQQAQVDNVVLITLDGARTQEVFGGLDLDVLRSTIGDRAVEETASYRRYWAPTPEARREKLMPFFWGTLMTEHGSVAGNRARGSTVELTNTRRFSYPGYSEILTGEAHDEEITSNDNRRYPFPTVLEFVKDSLELGINEVAAFTSWETFRWIVAHEAGAVTVNAGFEAYDHPDAAISALSAQQFETPTPWDTVRHDFYTFHLAMAHLETYRPRVLYLALGETDDWAHDGRYDRVLDALERTDVYLRDLWGFLQSDEQYRDNTAIIVAVDHGRGNTTSDWRGHGGDVEGAQYVWMALVSPALTRRGEWTDHATIYQNQVAATLARLLGLDYNQAHPSAGQPIAPLFPD